MSLGVLFVLVFIGGPLVFRALTQGRASRSRRGLVAVVALVGALGGLGVRYGFEHLWGRDMWVTGIGVALIWMAWIAVLAFGTLRLRAYDNGARMRRWTAVLGAMGTTIPWFGLASARAIGG
ncbi:hypothetical protein [Sulfitobacter sp. S190]|uniref:hypothetical protein n=1 Tax=Sulfitobacter sp. S190 TaxID=2867022 RepID=UPI0021A7E88A|nr:hypothetical protein [Sulfitobacter sp. S190]UWR22663.1 hypothetical protein K3756_01305 [Sulfitobacter sp. S190]